MFYTSLYFIIFYLIVVNIVNQIFVK